MDRDRGDTITSLYHKHQWTRPLARAFGQAMRKASDPEFKRLTDEWRILAGEVMDFAQDVVSGSWLWSGYERWNQRLFGVALPITEGDPGEGISANRVKHFLWKVVAYRLGAIPPEHPDVETLTTTFMDFWTKRASRFTEEKGYKQFITGPNEDGPLVQKKLLALGATSYFFRNDFYQTVLEGKDASEDVEGPDPDRVDDFLCQECSHWSGLGATDLLAEVLELPEERREDIRNWCERHVALYRVDEYGKECLQVTNLFSQREYRVATVGRENVPAGTHVYGSLVPWGDEWLWTGNPTVIPDGRDIDVTGMLEAMKMDMGPVLCRYWPEHREAVERAAREVYERKLAWYGGDLRIYESAAAMFEDMEGFMRASGDGVSEVEEGMREVGGSAALYIDYVEGSELTFRYDVLEGALVKGGVGLTDVEVARVREFVGSGATSLGCVWRVVEGVGVGSVGKAFGVGGMVGGYWMEWLLRCWKGEYYRKRYPNIGVV